MTAPHSFEFTFDGTVEELSRYVTEVFRDGASLRVHARVMPHPQEPEWFRRLGNYGALPGGLRPDSFRLVYDELLHYRKIGAIKELRTLTGWELGVAKDAVEQVFAPQVARKSDAVPAPSSGKEFTLE